MRKNMVDKRHPKLSIRKQCKLLDVNRNRLVAKTGKMTESDQKMARRIDELHMQFPEFGARRMSRYLQREGATTSRRRVGRIMKVMGLEAIYCRPRTSRRNPEHKIYPYLLRGKEITKADEVWCTDITYIPMSTGYAYLVAIMDWKTRAVLSWKLSNTLDAGFCIEALKEAYRKTGKAPQIFNTDQGSQFTSEDWIAEVKSSGALVSMDGKGCWVDNVFIERLWRAVKHEGVYMWSYENMHDLERALARWFDDYNRLKPHSSLEYKTPWECYSPETSLTWKQAA